jgi:hypothetical protein
MAELKARLEVCEERNNYFRKNGERYRKKHLLQRVEAAREEGKKDVAAKILAIIKRVQDQAFWWRLNYTCGKVKGRSPTLVQVEGPNDLVDEHLTKADVEMSYGQSSIARGSTLLRKPQFAKEGCVKTLGTMRSPLWLKQYWTEPMTSQNQKRLVLNYLSKLKNTT